jgi:acyl transferase domain-containing protein
MLLGDPIEVEALAEAYGRNRSRDNPLWIGSVKPNIGHLEAAAGIAGLIKVVLSFEHETIPPQPHFRAPNPGFPGTSSPSPCRWQRCPGSAAMLGGSGA